MTAVSTQHICTRRGNAGTMPGRNKAEADNEEGSKISRRNALQAIGATSAATVTGLAGCSSDGGDGGDGADGGDGTDGGDGDGGGGDGGSDIAGAEVTFVTEYTSDGFRDFYSTVNQAFEEETGATVNMEYAGVGEGARERLAQLQQAGNPPEIYHTDAAQATQFVQQGAAVPLTGVMETLIERYSDPGERFRLQVDGEDYMVPVLANIGTNWFRTDVYDSVPSSWSDMLSQAEEADSDDLRGTFISAGPSPCTDIQFLSFLYGNDGRICGRSDGEVEVIMDQGSNRDAWVETLEFLQDLHEFSPPNADTGCGEMTQGIATATSAHAWYIGARPKVQAVNQNTPFAEDVKPSPNLTPEGDDGTTAAIAEGFVTFEGANADAAAAYAEFFTREEYLVKSYFPDPVHNVPPFETIFETDEYQDTYQQIYEDTAWTAEDNEQYLENGQDFQTLPGETDPPNPYAGALLGSLNISDMLTEALVNDEDAGEMVDKYAEEMRSVLEDAKS